VSARVVLLCDLGGFVVSLLVRGSLGDAAAAGGAAGKLYKGIVAKLAALTNSTLQPCEGTTSGQSPNVFAPVTKTKQRSMALKEPVIAIVDDDEAVRDAVASLVRSHGYGTLKFASAQEFLDSPSRAQVACLISDVQMLGMTGLELYERLVASKTPVPTLLITAYPKNEERDRALRAGVICYLKKPFAEEELLACMQAALGKSSA